MNRVSDKWRVTFATVPPLGSVACELPADGHEVESWRDNSGNVCAQGYIADGYGWMDLVGTAKFRFDPSKREVTAFALPGVNPDLVRDAYCHAALPVALHFFGCEVLHASAVRTPRGVVAFCARSETGKSTIASAFGARGYPLWADDSVAIDSDDTGHGGGAIQTLLLPFNLRLRHPSAQYFNQGDDCAGETHADSEFAMSPLAALCVLERHEDPHRDVEIRRLSPSETFRALLPHAFCFSLNDQGRKRAMLKLYLNAAERTPTFAISFASGFKRLPNILDTIEGTLPAFAPQSVSDGGAGASRQACR